MARIKWRHVRVVAIRRHRVALRELLLLQAGVKMLAKLGIALRRLELPALRLDLITHSWLALA